MNRCRAGSRYCCVAKNVHKPGLGVLKVDDGACTEAGLPLDGGNVVVSPSPAKHFCNVFAGIRGEKMESPGRKPKGAPPSVSGGAVVVSSPAKHFCNVFAGVRGDTIPIPGCVPKGVS